MNTEQTLKALYEFTARNYEDLKSDWNKLPKQDKTRLPLTLFIIGVFSNTLEDYNKSTTQVGKDKNA